MTPEETIEDLRRQLADARAVNAQAEIVRDENERLRAENRRLRAALQAIKDWHAEIGLKNTVIGDNDPRA